MLNFAVVIYKCYASLGPAMMLLSSIAKNLLTFQKVWSYFDKSAKNITQDGMHDHALLIQSISMNQREGLIQMNKSCHVCEVVTE